MFAGQTGATIVDSLDTLYIMGMTEELAEARSWVEGCLNVDGTSPKKNGKKRGKNGKKNVNQDGSFFELSIRYLGGSYGNFATILDHFSALCHPSRAVWAYSTCVTMLTGCRLALSDVIPNSRLQLSAFTLTLTLTRSRSHPPTRSLTPARPHARTHARAHSLTHSTHSLTHPSTHPLTHSPTHPLTHSLTHSLTQSLSHALTHSLAQSHTRSLAPPLTHSLTRPLTYSLTHSPTHSTRFAYVGLLSAFALTGDGMFRDKATDIGDRLLVAFNTPTGVPFGVVNLRTGKTKTHWAPCIFDLGLVLTTHHVLS